MFENILKVLEETLSSKNWKIDYLEKENEELKDEIKVLKGQIDFLENELDFYRPMSKDCDKEACDK